MDQFHINRNNNDLAQSILTKKLSLWEHEKEHRVFKRNNPFIKVKIKELVFGIHTDNRQKGLLSKIAKHFCPNIKIKTIKRDLLETGNLRNYEIA